MQHLLDACDLMEAAGRTHLPVPIREIRRMATRIGKAKVTTTKSGRARVQPAKARTSVSQKIGRKAKADRAENGLRKNRSKSA
jgi:hypothetical protein